MRILLADDHVAVRAALRLLIEQESRFVIVGESASAGALLLHAQRLCPDVVLLDWELSGSRSLPVELRALCSRVDTIALSSRTEAYAEAIQGGAADFVSKGDPPECLLGALRRLEARRLPA